MKIGRPEPGDEIPLPIEVVEQIVFHIANNDADPHSRQRRLWSLCLVSSSWYSVAVKWLYQAPLLDTKNFELLARTLCPPLRAKDRAIGLEDLVMHLHMADLAYITTRATTAKLLRRTRKSLQSFSAPSYSMSISSLAPISKLTVLQHLDLSRDRYDFSLTDLLRATQHLGDLRFLSLPRGAVDIYRQNDHAAPPLWPPGLVSLQVNASVPSTPEQRLYFFSDLPERIKALTFRYVQNWRQATILFIGLLTDTAPHVTDMTLDEVGGVTLYEEDFLLSDLFEVFSNLVRMSLPVTVLHFRSLLEPFAHCQRPRFREMNFQEVPNEQKVDATAVRNNVSAMVELIPSMRKVTLPQSCSNPDIMHNPELIQLSQALVERWQDASLESKGLFAASKSGELVQICPTLRSVDP